MAAERDAAFVLDCGGKRAPRRFGTSERLSSSTAGSSACKRRRAIASRVPSRFPAVVQMRSPESLSVLTACLPNRGLFASIPANP